MTNHILLNGIVGSTAYGMAGPYSDVDYLGVYAMDTPDLVRLARPTETITGTNPDATLHEIGKYCSLALKCNPTVLELLWLDEYQIKSRAGQELICIRDAFLSAKAVRNAYYGYAQGQFERIRSRGDNSFSADTRKRTAKHARHLMRLLDQGIKLARTGVLEIRVLPGQADLYFEFGDEVAAGNLQIAADLLEAASYEWDEVIDNPELCALTPQPARMVVDDYLATLREYYWRKHDWNE